MHHHLLALIASAALLALNSQAAIIEVVKYNLGEPGSLGATDYKLPQDSSGNGHHLNGPFSTLNSVSADIPTAINGISTASLNVVGGVGYGAAQGTSVVPTQNFAVEFWFKTASVGCLFSGKDSGNGDLYIALDANRAPFVILQNVGYIAQGGAAIPVSTWTHFAVINTAQTSTFYLNGIATGTPLYSTLAPLAFGGFTLGLAPGGVAAFTGNLDNFRIFTFVPGVDNPVANLQIPEPTALALLGLGALALLRRRRA